MPQPVSEAHLILTPTTAPNHPARRSADGEPKRQRCTVALWWAVYQFGLHRVRHVPQRRAAGWHGVAGAGIGANVPGLAIRFISMIEFGVPGAEPCRPSNA